MNNRLPIALILVCAALTALLILLFRQRPEYDLTALLTANGIMFILSIAAWAILRRNVSERPQAFVRGVYGATMLRLFVCLVGIISYAMIKKPALHKPSLFIMFGIYAVYTIIETMTFSQQARKMQ
jgi:amino acid transporter